MDADPATRTAIAELVADTFRRLSTPGSDPGALFSHPDMAGAGSGLGELAYGPVAARGMGTAVASLGFTWSVEQVTVWQEGDVAWAQILGSVRTRRGGAEDDVPYWTTGVFARDGSGWHWRYWGGSEPQAEPRV